MKEDICNILQCAGLIHDIGNPPFGHFGETAIREWFKQHLSGLMYNGRSAEELLTPQMREDFYNFEGNAQALRLVTKLHYLVDEHGMNLTYALLNTIVKYPVASTGIDKSAGNIKDKKMGYYYADEDIFKEIQEATGTNGCRHPLTFILEAADDIAYNTADIEDAFIKGFISYHQLREEIIKLQEDYGCGEGEEYFNSLEKLDALYERGKERGEKSPEEYAVKNWIVKVQGYLIYCATCGFTSNYTQIMEGIYKKDLFHGTYGADLMNLLGEMACRYVFTSQQIYKMEVTESVILNFLMDKFVSAVMKYDNPYETPDSIDERMISFVSDNYKSCYHFHSQGKNETEKIYLRLLLITDYICGMTDSYAKRLYQELKAIF